MRKPVSGTAVLPFIHCCTIQGESYLVFAEDIALGNAVEQGVSNLPGSSSHQHSDRFTLQGNDTASPTAPHFGLTPGKNQVTAAITLELFNLDERQIRPSSWDHISGSARTISDFSACFLQEQTTIAKRSLRIAPGKLVKCQE